MRHEHWPLFALRVTTPHMELRYLDDDLADSLVSLAANIHDPAFAPFAVPWTDVSEPQLQQEALRFFWQSRAGTRPELWRLQFAVIVDGAPIGMCDLTAEQFPILRQFETGSWLAGDRQGAGIGTEMRRAALHLGFVGLDAHYATTGAWHDNGPSLGVTRKLGYREEGRRWSMRRDAGDEQIVFRMDRAHHETIRRDDVELHGIAAARDFLGL